MTVSDVISRYGEEHAATTADPVRIGYAIDALDAWWGDLPVSKVSKATCKKYAAERGVSPGTVRRELGTLVAALNHCNGTLISGVPATWLPPRPPSRERWSTRDEAAKLIRAARADPRTRHLARFILIATYTASRKAVILGLKFRPHHAGGWVDTKNGVLYRRASKTTETRKRAPAVRIPPKLLAHLKRWEREGSPWVVSYRGCGVASIKSAWATVRERAELEDVVPHTLRHTAITWAMQAGVERWAACGFFGISLEELERTYGHHHPDHQSSAVDAVNRGGRR